MCAKHYENPTMLSKVTAKNVGDVFLRHTVVLLAGPKDHWLVAAPRQKVKRTGLTDAGLSLLDAATEDGSLGSLAMILGLG